MKMDGLPDQGKISADTFSYLYGKLESLDVQTIVDSMLNVPELRGALKQKLPLITEEGNNEKMKKLDSDLVDSSIYTSQRLTPPGSVPSQFSGSPMGKMSAASNSPLLGNGILDYLAASQIMNHQYQQLISQSLLLGSWKANAQTTRMDKDMLNGSHSPTSRSTSLHSSPTMEEGSDLSSDPQEVPCPECHTSVSLSEIHDHVENWCQGRIQPTQKEKEKGMENSFLDVTNLDYSSIDSSHPDDHHAIIQRRQRRSLKPSWSCDQCDLAFRNKSDLKRHKITHTLGGGFICDTCSKPFAKVELLRRHEQQIHSEINRQPWPCPDCMKTFSNKYNLAVHQRIHSGELPFCCAQCDERFRVKCSMQNHMRSKHALTSDFDFQPDRNN